MSQILLSRTVSLPSMGPMCFQRISARQRKQSVFQFTDQFDYNVLLCQKMIFRKILLTQCPRPHARPGGSNPVIYVLAEAGRNFD